MRPTEWHTHSEPSSTSIVRENHQRRARSSGRVLSLMSGAAAVNGPPRLKAAKVVRGDIYASKPSLTKAVTRMLLSEGRTVKRGNGGSRQAVYRCQGQVVYLVDDNKNEMGCLFRINGCKRGKTGEWNVTFVHDEHLNCSGARGKRGPGAAMVEDVGTAIVANNPTVSARALGDIMKAQTGVTLSRRTSSRVKCTAVTNTNLDSREGFAVLGSYLSPIAQDCSGSVTDVEWDTKGRFKRLFVMLGRSVNVAVESPQEIFCMDCAHLKGTWNGIYSLLTVKDADNKVVIVCLVAHKKNQEVYR
ncbi:unnamed protein product [Sphacelaria rigidula]